MRYVIALIVGLSVMVLVSSASAQSPCVTLKPGKSLGKISIGMTQAQLKATGLPIKDGFTEGVFEVGQYQVWTDKTGVTAVRLSLGGVQCLEIPGKSRLNISQKTPMADIAQYLGTCGPIAHNRGGNVIACGDNTGVLGHMGGMDIGIGDHFSAPATTCDAYITPGAPGSKTASVEVEENKTYCVDSRVFSPQLTSKLKPADLTALDGELRYNTCKTTANRGATVVDCPYQGVSFVFGGPTLMLSKINAIEMKQ